MSWACLQNNDEMLLPILQGNHIPIDLLWLVTILLIYKNNEVFVVDIRWLTV
jgi:hypothetical protein